MEIDTTWGHDGEGITTTNKFIGKWYTVEIQKEPIFAVLYEHLHLVEMKYFNDFKVLEHLIINYGEEKNTDQDKKNDNWVTRILPF